MLLLDPVLESAEGRGRGEGGVALDFGVFGGELPEGIVAEVLVVVEVFATGGEGEDALGEQPALGVSDESGVAGIGDGRVEGVDESE